jgi:hypothetical protein
MKAVLFILAGIFTASMSRSQNTEQFKGEDVPDTIYFVELDTFSITARPLYNFNYSKYESIVDRVYPYADTAILILNELHLVESGLSKRKDVKKYRKELEEELRDKFESKLKNFSRSQGEVLIDIIERNTGQSMYSILKDVKSGGTAFWWQNLSKVYGYDLKDGYDPDNNPTLEMIIAAYEEKHSKPK